MKRTAFALMLVCALASPLAAQPVTCAPPPTNDFVRIPELTSSGGKLRGTLRFTAQQQCLPTRVPASAQSPGTDSLPKSTYTWGPQFVRVMYGLEATPALPPVPANTYPYPVPGPTLRARVGEMVQLTLINHIDPGQFPYSIDQGEKSPQGGCDETRFYPVNPGTKLADVFPNCFHGSSTVNIHFHGLHVNPNSTGDNVFLQIRPSLRTRDAANQPVVTPESVRAAFDEFFARCEQELPSNRPLRQWPFVWADLPVSWTAQQKNLLLEYDKTAGRQLWPANERMLADGEWPQFYIGAYPYCYRIPEYREKAWPPAPPVDMHAAHTGGKGLAEAPGIEPRRPLIMGQAPGTHWYHAHKHGSTAINVANGLTGAFIIEGQYDDDLNAFYGKDWARTQPVMVINQLGVTPNLERGGGGVNAQGLGTGPDKGPSFAVNGRITPVLTMKPGEVQLWRIVNSSGRAGTYFTGPPKGFKWMQLAQDGVQFTDANYKKTLNRPFLLASGNRADILVMAPATGGTFDFLVQNAVDQSDIFGPNALPPNALLSVNVTGSAATGNNTKFIPNAPASPSFLADISEDEVRGTKQIVFATDFGTPPPAATHTINGHQFSGEVGETVLLNKVEEWTISNRTNASAGPAIAHPFHIHVNPFQVVEVFAPNDYLLDKNGQPVKDAKGNLLRQYVFDKKQQVNPAQCYVNPNDKTTWKPCKSVARPANIWWDVFPIPTGVEATNAAGTAYKDAKGNPILVPGYFRMRSRFVDYEGEYVLHCHILAHEDRGMMTVVKVTPLRPLNSHH